ncbi:hypothetical protein L2E82_47992 [Cichorium intybus]|uniref:Uncharacterized protein n=1 Tax=Cichorium intybus TaxID=13427 RepID=A0ACB8YY37_CICIN|nr:hypothetical protein L2E82_47992 [Cichorium intybus]
MLNKQSVSKDDQEDHSYSPSFTPEVDRVGGELSRSNGELTLPGVAKVQKSRVESSLLEKLNDFVKLGHAMGYSIK